MAFNTLKNIAIRGIACAVPKMVINAEHYNTLLGGNTVKKIVAMTGIRERHIAPCGPGIPSITASDLCYEAADRLIAHLNVDRSSIDAVIMVTQYPDYGASPSNACVLQYRLGLSNDCMAYDINQGCTGYIYGLYAGGCHLQGGRNKRILVLAGDAMQKVSEVDKSQMMLFGDCGSATLLECNEECKGTSEDMNFLIKTIGEGFRHLIVPAGGSRHRWADEKKKDRGDGIMRSDFDAYMNGTEVFNFTIREVPKLIKEYYEGMHQDNDTYDLFVFHQANLFMLNYIADKLKIDKAKMPLSLDRYGNTSSASIPLTICDYFNRETNEDNKLNILACGFGVGLSLGVTNFKLHKMQCLPVIEIDHGWEDGVL